MLGIKACATTACLRERILYLTEFSVPVQQVWFGSASLLVFSMFQHGKNSVSNHRAKSSPASDQSGGNGEKSEGAGSGEEVDGRELCSHYMLFTGKLYRKHRGWHARVR